MAKLEALENMKAQEMAYGCVHSLNASAKDLREARENGADIEEIRALEAALNTHKEHFMRAELCEALELYAEQSRNCSELEQVTPDFVREIVRDSVYGDKRNLRNLLRKHPDFREGFDGVLVKGCVNYEPSFENIWHRIREIIEPAVEAARKSDDFDKADDIVKAARWFVTCETLDNLKAARLEKLEAIAPHAYHRGKKITKILRDFCKEIGVVDESRGSDWNRLYAKVCDEFSGKREFTALFSIGVPSFMTMSNPHYDKRGATMQSCHSLDSDHSYKNGCAGYARDGVTIIAYVCKDFTNPESVYTRKTMRQLFHYQNGLLIQSRLYKTNTNGDSYGGTHGIQPESKILREMLQKILADCEGCPNLWETFRYYDNAHRVHIYDNDDFTGYSDYSYEDNAAMASILRDKSDDWENFEVGESGLCLHCGCESDEIICEDCRGTQCYECGEYHHETYTVYDCYGEEHEVCETCYERHYEECDNCGEAHSRRSMSTAVNCYGDEVYVCESCANSGDYSECPDCDRLCCCDDMERVYDSCGNETWVCPDCRDNYYTQCEECSDYYPSADVEDGLCPNCRDNQANDEEVTEENNETASA